MSSRVPHDRPSTDPRRPAESSGPDAVEWIADDGAPAGAPEPRGESSDAGESNTGRKFPCPGCGAKLDFDPTQRALKCPYCGYARQVDDSAGQVAERDWDEYWRTAERDHGATIAGRSSEARCRACAAVVLLEDKVATDKCPYCGNDLDNRPVSAQDMILPEGILPFKVDLKRARSAFNDWIAGRWFAPSDLKHLADLGRFNGVYVPFWTYDSMTNTNYTGQRGDNYQVVETYTDTETYTTTNAQGQQVTETRPVTRTRVVTHIRWTYASGHVEHFFDDVLVCASKSIPDSLMQQLSPWDLGNYEPFRADFLAGFQTERYTVGLKEGFDVARGVMDTAIRGLCCQDIGGDHQQLDAVQTRHSAITFKHVLHPVWLAPYRYRGALHRIAINARTGEVVGTRPYSFWKILTFILALLVIAGVVFLVAGGLQSIQRHRAAWPPQQTPPRQAPQQPERPLPAEKPLEAPPRGEFDARRRDHRPPRIVFARSSRPARRAWDRRVSLSAASLPW